MVKDSQGGDIRAITKTENKLTTWGNIRVQHLVRSTKLLRTFTISIENFRKTHTDSLL